MYVNASIIGLLLVLNLITYICGIISKINVVIRRQKIHVEINQACIFIIRMHIHYQNAYSLFSLFFYEKG